MFSKYSRFVVHVIMPLVFGGLIYIFLRDPKLRMFKWFDFISVGPLISRLRFTAAPFEHAVPMWIQFSIPNALWVYALTGFMSLVWADTDSRAKPFWLLLGLLLGAGIELGQALNVIPGAFDITDLALCIVAAPLALLITSNLFVTRRRLNDFTT